MGIFGGYNEEEFLDPDEIRLRRESAARSRNVHKQCVADHRADHPGSILPVNNTRPHTDCKADHADDIDPTKLLSLIAGVFIVVMVIVVAIIMSIVS